MTSSQSPVASIWMEDGRTVKASPIKVLQTPTSKVITVSAPAGTTINQSLQTEILKYYRDAGLASIKTSNLVQNPNGTLGIKLNQTDSKGFPLNKPSLPVVTIPVSLASPSAKMSPVQLKTEQQPVILPRGSTSQLSNSPMILSTPSRLSMSQAQMIPGYSPRTPILAASPNSWRKRTAADFPDVEIFESKRKKGEKGGKGLRHFSMKVCEKVQKKGVTSYNEVADELVQEFSDPRNMSPTDQAYDQKNIRRRVYDALNVLMAMNIISKEKKEIRWIGLPTNSAQECQNLEVERARKIERIRYKTQQLQELIIQQIAFKNLVQRNKELERRQGPLSSNTAIHLPFIIVNTNKKTVIDCSISNDKYEYLFNFDNMFEIHDDIEVLKRMNMAHGLEKGECSNENLKKVVKLVPKSLEPYVYEMANVSSSSSSITAGPSGIKRLLPVSGMAATNIPSTAVMLSSAVVNNNSNDAADAEVAITNSRALSRQSSVGSFSDLTPSRAATETPSEAFSNDDDEDSDIDDI